MAFAGLSYGQTITCTGDGSVGGANPLLRAEGETELVADVATAGCTSGVGPATSGTVTVTLSAPVTSKSESTTATFPGNSEATLQITGSAPIPGIVSGSQVSFTVPAGGFPVGAFTLIVSNIRVNATMATSPQVAEVLLVTYNTAAFAQAQVVAGLTNPVSVGYVTPSLKTAVSVQPFINSTGGYGAATTSNQYGFASTTAPAAGATNSNTTSNFPTCNGFPLSTSTTAFSAAVGGEDPAFTLAIQELFNGAFKTQFGENGSYTGGLSGLPGTVGTLASGLNASVGIGGGTQATQLQVVFTNVPSAGTIYLPISVTQGGTVLTLQGSGISALTSPAALNFIAPVGVYPFTPSGGTVTAIYVVTATSGGNGASAAGTFNLPVYFNVAANLAPVQTTAMTAAVTYLPAANITGPQGTIPVFAPSTASVSTFTVTACQTTLLFPFVTNSSGFETGIEIANMTTDNLAKSGAASSATPTTGTCVINFYGNTTTQPAAYTTSTLGAYSTSPSQAPIFANTLTAMAVPNFSGYAIALCNFLDAHGFAYIVDNFGQSNGTAEGYVANAINGSNRGGPDGGQGQ